MTVMRYNLGMSKHPDNRFHPSFPGQQEGEEIQLIFRHHPAVMRRALISGLVLLVLAVLPLDFVFTWWLVKLALIVLALVLGYWLYQWVGWYYSIYIATDRRLIEIKQKGFFNRQFIEFRLDRIQNLHYHVKGIQGVIFKYGDITAQTITGELSMEMIHHPVAIHGQLMEIVRRANS